jgi:hypothetical protein
MDSCSPFKEIQEHCSFRLGFGSGIVRKRSEGEIVIEEICMPGDSGWNCILNN